MHHLYKVSKKAKRDIRFSGTGVTSSCESPGGCQESTQDFQKNSQHFQLFSHLSHLC